MRALTLGRIPGFESDHSFHVPDHVDHVARTYESDECRMFYENLQNDLKKKNAKNKKKKKPKKKDTRSERCQSFG